MRAFAARNKEKGGTESRVQSLWKYMYKESNLWKLKQERAAVGPSSLCDHDKYRTSVKSSVVKSNTKLREGVKERAERVVLTIAVTLR